MPTKVSGVTIFGHDHLLPLPRSVYGSAQVRAALRFVRLAAVELTNLSWTLHPWSERCGKKGGRGTVRLSILVAISIETDLGRSHPPLPDGLRCSDECHPSGTAAAYATDC